MQYFWYHSPVRFYRTQEELQDMTNPQNTQYFGSVGNPYPLEAGELHRFLIPNHNNEIIDPIIDDEFTMWCGGQQIGCEFGFIGTKLFRVTFASSQYISGQLEIRRGGDTMYWSNCVRFVDSTDADGRKFIRIATKHYYNRGLFAFDGTSYDWIITNLPAYCLGMFTVDAEISNARIGGNNSLKTRETYIDEIVSYEFLSEGDANILAFIQVHVTNNHFFIDGTKRTAVDKLDADEFAMSGRMRFANVKNPDGFNVTFDDEQIFDDVLRSVLSDNNRTIIYTHDNNTAIPT